MKDFFDFKLILYDFSDVDGDKARSNTSSRVGKIKVICLVKFVNELLNFIDPIVNPLPSLTEQVKEIPQVPRNSLSFSAFLVDLGTLSIKNRFVHEPVSTIHEEEELKSRTINKKR